MTEAAESNGLIGMEQFGFRRGRSTLDAIFVLSTLLKKAKSKNCPYVTAFVDIAKVPLTPIYSQIQLTNNSRLTTLSGALLSSPSLLLLVLGGKLYP